MTGPPGRRLRVAIATTEPLTSRLAGPGIRALAIAEALAAEHEVQLVTTERAGRAGAGFTIRSVDDRGLRQVERWCDVLVVQGWVLSGRPFLVGTSKVVVCDLPDAGPSVRLVAPETSGYLPGDMRIPVAAEAADDYGISRADLVFHSLNLPRGIPILDAATHAEHEIRQDLAPAMGVRHLGMELNGEQPGFRGRHGSYRTSFGASQHAEPLGRHTHGVAMAHPYLLAPADTVQNGVGVQHIELRESILAAIALLNLPAQQMRHQLLPIADP